MKKRGLTLWLPIAFLLCPSGPLSGQRILGKVVDSDSGPLAHALVTVTSEVGAPVGHAMSDEAGNFVVELKDAGEGFRVRVEQIGFATVESDAVSVGTDNDAFVRLELHVRAINVTGVTVTAIEDSACSEQAYNAALVDQVWGEAVKALRMVTWAAENADVGFEIQMTETDFLPDGRTVQDVQEGVSWGSGTQPFQTADHETLYTSGFVLDAPNGRRFLVPDASYLLSSRFLETHCLRWQGSSADGARVGLFFKPRRSRSEPEIAGTIWVDGESGALTEVSFEYVNVYIGADEVVARGNLSLGQLTSGEWLIDEWWVNTPRIGVRPRQLGFGGQDSVVVGFRERRGTVLRAWTDDSVRLAAQAGDSVPTGGEIVNEPVVRVIPVEGNDSGAQEASGAIVFGEISDLETGEPIAGVEVALLPSGRTAITNDGGGFLFPDPPSGNETLRMRHLGYGEQTEEVEIPDAGGIELVIQLEALPIELAGVEAVGQATFERDGSIAGTRFDGMTPTEVEAILPRVQTAADLLRSANIPGLKVADQMIPYGPLNMATMGTCVTTNRMRSRSAGPGQCQMVELYIDDIRIPTADAAIRLRQFDARTISHFRLLSALEAGALYGTGSQNGVLLIYTHGN